MPTCGRLLAFLDVEVTGPILSADANFWDIAEFAEWAIDNLKIPAGPRPGLLVFEGWCDENHSLEGMWRELTFWELCLLRNGDDIWEAPTPENVEEQKQ